MIWCKIKDWLYVKMGDEVGISYGSCQVILAEHWE
jgi:hypothetical protein